MRMARIILSLGSLAITLSITLNVVAESNVRRRIIAGQEVPSERDDQTQKFNQLFQQQGLEYEVEFAKLPEKASVPKWRIPYSTSIHPERSGGLSAAGSGSVPVLRRYDQAFPNDDGSAYDYDRRRKLRTGVRRIGLFGPSRSYTYYAAESWEGYCSGFTASTIMHPEPMRAVDAGLVGGTPGVVFQPSDIKALLCAAYNRTRKDSYLFVAPASSRTGGPNMGTFHLALTNYIGRAGHPVGIDRTKGRVTWNNPIYEYTVSSIRDAGRRGDIHYKDVTTKITYTWYGEDDLVQTDAETGERIKQPSRSLTIRYYLELDEAGKIVGGQALSHAGHFLWIPLFPVQGIRDQSSPGNPYLDVQQVLALARQSALPEVQERYSQLGIASRVDPQIAIRAEAERQRRLEELAEQQRKQREQAAAEAEAQTIVLAGNDSAAE